MLLAGVDEPLIVIDWSDLKKDQSMHLAARLGAGGRAQPGRTAPRSRGGKKLSRLSTMIWVNFREALR